MCTISCSCVCPSAKYDAGHCTNTQNGWISAGSICVLLASNIVCIQQTKTESSENFWILYSKTCWNQVCLQQSYISIQYSVPSYTIYFIDFHWERKKIKIQLLVVSQTWLEARFNDAWVCVGIMLQSSPRWKAFISWISQLHNLGQHLLLWISLRLSAFSCFKAYLRSSNDSACSVSKLSSRLIPFIIPLLFPYRWQAGPNLDASEVSHVLERPSTSPPPSGPPKQESAVAAAPHLARHWAVAAQQGAQWIAAMKRL